MMKISIFEQEISPFKQVLVVFVGATSIILFSWICKKIGLFDSNLLFPWEIATGTMLLFGVFNSILSINAQNFAKYWSGSIYSYMGLALANGMVAWGFSGVAIGDAESFKSIYLVVTFGFLVFISLVNILKKVVDFAQKEEWNQPLPKNRKR